MHADLASEPDGIFRVLHRVELESDYDKSLRTVAVEELLVARHLFLAGLAPGGPKIDEHYLAAKVGRGNLASSLQIFNGKIGQARTDFACGGRGFFLFWPRKARRMHIASGERDRSEAQQ